MGPTRSKCTSAEEFYYQNVLEKHTFKVTVISSKVDESWSWLSYQNMAFSSYHHIILSRSLFNKRSKHHFINITRSRSRGIIISIYILLWKFPGISAAQNVSFQSYWHICSILNANLTVITLWEILWWDFSTLSKWLALVTNCVDYYINADKFPLLFWHTRPILSRKSICCCVVIFRLMLYHTVYPENCAHALFVSLQWRHYGRDGVSNHQPHHCLFNRLFRRWSKKTSKFRITGHLYPRKMKPSL